MRDGQKKEMKDGKFEGVQKTAQCEVLDSLVKNRGEGMEMRRQRGSKEVRL